MTRHGSAILPCREYVKGNTVETLAKNACDFWGPNTAMVVFDITRPNGAQSRVAIADAANFDPKQIGKHEGFMHDQTWANLGSGVCVGAFELNEDGTVGKIHGDLDAKSKIRTVYCYK